MDACARQRTEQNAREDLKRSMREQPAAEDATFGLVPDVRAAHRHVPVRSIDWLVLDCQSVCRFFSVSTVGHLGVRCF